jgi:GT2 family glycosyltransferase
MAPRFSVVTPVYNTKARDLEECITSVLSQSLGDWELCLVDDKSPDRRVRRVLDRAAELDPRVRVMFRESNGGIVAASNDGLGMATGEFVALLDHDDALEPDALERVAALLDSDPEIDYVYSDESLMTEKGSIIERFYKPDWSPERYRSQMYVCHLSVIRRQLLVDVGGFRSGFDGSQDFDLMFRVTEKARKVGHVRNILYHWRMAETSVANNAAAKPYAYEAGTAAIESHLERTGIDASVERLSEFPGNYVVHRQLKGSPTVGVLLPRTEMATDVWGSLRHQRKETEQSLRDHESDLALLFIDTDTMSVDRASAINANVGQVQTDFVFISGEAMATATSGWARELASLAQESGVGAVAGVSYDEGSLVHHGGYWFTPHFAERTYFSYPMWNRGQRTVLETVHELSAVDASGMMMRRDLFLEMGGLDESLPPPWDMVDLCLRLQSRGYTVLLNPHVMFWDFTVDALKDRWRIRLPKELRARWGHVLESDPYRPHRPLRESVESRRPLWHPQRFKDWEKTRRRSGE